MPAAEQRGIIIEKTFLMEEKTENGQ